MLKSIMHAVLISSAIAFSGCVTAASPAKGVGVVPLNIDSPKYKPYQEIPFDEVKEYTNNSGVSIYVVTERFGELQYESDALMGKPLQQMEAAEERNMLIDFGQQIVEYYLTSVYGIPKHDIKVGNTYIGVPSSIPEGSIVLSDVIFYHQDKRYNARIGIWTSDLESNDGKHQIMFMYPHTH